MKNTWKRLVSMFLLVLALCTTMVPALAAGKGNNGRSNRPAVTTQAKSRSTHTTVITTKSATYSLIVTTVK